MHKRYRQTDGRTDGRLHIANVTVVFLTVLSCLFVAKRLDASRCHLVWSGLRAIANCDFHPERFAEFLSLRIAQTVPVFMPAGAYSRSTCGFFDVAMVNNFFLVNKMMLKCLD